MLENNNNNNYNDVNFTLVENESPDVTNNVQSSAVPPAVQAIPPQAAASHKKNSAASKVIAGVLAVVLIGGASGFGGAYLSNSIYGNNSAAVVEDVKTPKDETKPAETSAAPVSSAPNAETDKIETMLNTTDSSATAASLSTTDVIKKVTDSVVLITSEFSSNGTTESSSGTGTGVIMTDDGYIFTNCHVIETESYVLDNSSRSPFGGLFGNNYTTTVEKASKVTVTLGDGTEYKAEIIGSDSSTDLAILKIDAKGLTPAEIGSSDDLELGQKAITLGYPLGLGLSASEGIVSGLNKEMTIELAGGGSSDMTLIQTTAAINPGNSGGPLLNEFGQVVGITSSKIVSSSIEGIGFAIPITDAMPLLNELLETGTVTDTTPKIGITGTNINEAVARYYSLPVSKGVLVISVDTNSSADKAGIKEGDVIVGADGEDVNDMTGLISLKNKHKIGETMIITLARSNGNIDIEITL